MEPKQLADFLRNHWATIAVVFVVLTPVIWGAASLYYNGRVETLREQVNTLRVQADALREQKEFLEAKLKAPAEFSGSLSPPTSDAPSPRATDAPKYKYPLISSASRPSKDDVRQLARFYGLFTEWMVNPHLQFKEGDVSYFFERGLSEAGLKREFESRRVVLERAEKSGQKIGSSGDLSHFAEQLQGQVTGR